ncbi:hypothetical protein IWQ60_012236, partial [Tieghemiomyces parasiticus]
MSDAKASDASAESDKLSSETVQQLVENYLVGPNLSDIFTLREFQQFFPKVHRTHPDVSSIHLTYVTWRREIHQLVRQSIAEEIPNDILTTHASKAGQGSAMARQHVTVVEATEILERAANDIDSQIRDLETECQHYQRSIHR